jgi:hypothetical protein
LNVTTTGAAIDRVAAELAVYDLLVALGRDVGDGAGVAVGTGFGDGAAGGGGAGVTVGGTIVGTTSVGAAARTVGAGVGVASRLQPHSANAMRSQAARCRLVLVFIMRSTPIARQISRQVLCVSLALSCDLRHAPAPSLRPPTWSPLHVAT